MTHQAQHGRGGHQAVGIEHDHMVVAPSAPRQFAQIACLEACSPGGAGRGSRCEMTQFSCEAVPSAAAISQAAVAQQMEAEAMGPGRPEALDHGSEPKTRATSSWRMAAQIATRAVTAPSGVRRRAGLV
jgi:hypothetical protein